MSGNSLANPEQPLKAQSGGVRRRTVLTSERAGVWRGRHDHGQSRRADQTGVLAKQGGGNQGPGPSGNGRFRSAKHNGALPQFLEERRRKDLPGLRKSSTHHIDGKIERIDQIGQHDAQGPSGVVKNLSRDRVAFEGALKYSPRADPLSWFLRAPQVRGTAAGNGLQSRILYGCRRCVLLPTTATAADSGSSFWDYSAVSEFAGHADRTVPGQAMKDKSAAHAGSQSQHTEIVGMTPRAHPLLAEGRAVGVILKNHGGAKFRFKMFSHGIVSPSRQVGR